MFFFFKQKTAYEVYQCDWSSDVCSSDLKLACLLDDAVGVAAGPDAYAHHGRVGTDDACPGDGDDVGSPPLVLTGNQDDWSRAQEC